MDDKKPEVGILEKTLFLEQLIQNLEERIDFLDNTELVEDALLRIV